MELQPHQQRVVAEKKELDVKRDKLTEFLKGPAPNFVGTEELERLTRQLCIMGDYSNILAERIAHF